jgi:hypothetical protein
VAKVKHGTSAGAVVLTPVSDDVAHWYSGVVVDLNAQDEIVGVELVNIVPKTVMLAQEFAAANDLEWPSSIGIRYRHEL